MPVWLLMQPDSGSFGRSKRHQQQKQQAGGGDSSCSSSPSSSSSSSSSSSLLSSSSSSSSAQQKKESAHRRKGKILSSQLDLGFRQQTLEKTFSEPSITVDRPVKLKQEADLKVRSGLSCAEDRSQQAAVRRCMTDVDLPKLPQAPDLLQLFNIFQFNSPHLPPSRMLVNVTLVGSIQAIRLLVECNSSVQDVVKAALKAYAKEGRIPRHSHKHEAYGLHLSPFSLESINPKEVISSLGTRSFYLSASAQHTSEASKTSRDAKSWWNLLGFNFT